MWGKLALLFGLAACAGCHVFTSTTDCEDDGDCQRGARCHPEGKFCEGEDALPVIAASFPFSGDLTDIGRDVVDGLGLAEALINERGGVLGKELHVVASDDRTTVEQSVDNVRSFVRQRAAAIVGPLTSDQVLATQSITYDAHVLQIAPAAGSPAIGAAQPASPERYLFQTISPVRSGSAAAIVLFARSGPPGGAACGSMAIVHGEDAIGIAYRDAVKELFEANGGCVVADIVLPPDALSYRDQAAAIIAAQPDCATLVAFAQNGVEVINSFKEQADADSRDWSRFYFIGTTPLHSDTFLEASRTLPSNPAEGVFGADEDTRPETQAYVQVRDAYNERYGRVRGTELPIFVSNAFDATMLAALSIEHAGSVLDGERIRDGLLAISGTDGARTVFGPLDFGEATRAIREGRAIRYEGASSKLVFDERGAVRSPTLIWRVNEGQFENIQRYSEDDVSMLLMRTPMPGTCP